MTDPAELDPHRPPRKEDRPCCNEARDGDGRLPIGFCSPECLGRPDVWRGYATTVNADRRRQRRGELDERRRRLGLGG